MRSRAAVVLLATVATGVLCLALVARSDDRELAFTLGVTPSSVVVNPAPDAEVCQLPIEVAEPFTGVDVKLESSPPGPPLELVVLGLPGRTPLARGRLDGGYRGISELSVALDRTVAADQRVAVCLRNRGKDRVVIFGNYELASRTSHLELNGKREPTDLGLVFTREPRSALSQVPEIFQRASLFRPSWVGEWTYWLLIALLLLAAPVLLARALTDVFGNGRR